MMVLETIPILRRPPGRVMACSNWNAGAALLIANGSGFVREDGRLVFYGEPSANFYAVGNELVVFGTRSATACGPFYVVRPSEPAITIGNVDRSPYSINLGILGRRAVWLNNNQVYLSDKKDRLIEVPSDRDYSLYTGERFAVLVGTQRGTLSGVYLIEPNSVLRLISLPPLIGTILDVRCEFSCDAAWIMATLEYESQQTEYMLAISRAGDLIGMGCCDADSQLAKILGSTRQYCAYQRANGNKLLVRLAALGKGQLIEFGIKGDGNRIAVRHITRTRNTEAVQHLVHQNNRFHLVTNQPAQSLAVARAPPALISGKCMPC